MRLSPDDTGDPSRPKPGMVPGESVDHYQQRIQYWKNQNNAADTAQEKANAAQANTPGGTFATPNMSIDPEVVPDVSMRPSQSWLGTEAAFNKTAYDQPGYLQKSMEGVADQSNLMGPSQDSDPEAQALSQKAQQYYGSNLNQLAKAAIPKSIAATTNLQTQDVNNRSAIYSNMQARAQINYREALMKREHALGVAIMQRDLYGSLFGGIAKVAGSGSAAMISTPAGSQSYYASQMTAPELNSGYSTTSGAPNLGIPGVDPAPPSGPGLGMNFDFGEP